MDLTEQIKGTNMSATNYISYFRKRFGDRVMCSANYDEAKKGIRDALYHLDEESKYGHRYNRYKDDDIEQDEIKRLRSDIAYRDANAIGACPSTHRVLWSLPPAHNHIEFDNGDDFTFNMQIHFYVMDCVIWCNILGRKPTEHMLIWLFFNYVEKYARRTSPNNWSTKVTYDKILNSLLSIVKMYQWIPNDVFQEAIRHQKDESILQRNLANYKSRYKKKDGDIYVLKSENNFAASKHSNSATCRAKYNAKQMAIITDLKISRNEASRRLKELGYSICPATVWNIRKRLAIEKEEREKKQHVGPLDF